MKSKIVIILILISMKLACENNNRILEDIENDDDIEMTINNENFDVFKYSKQIGNETLLLYRVTDFVLNELIGKKAKNQIVDKNKLYQFLLILANEYNSNTSLEINPYHNIYHAAEVTQNLYTYLKKTKKSIPFLFSDTYVKEKEELEFQSNIDYIDLDIFALIIAAICHDFRHTGRDNNFYLNYKEKIPFAKVLKKYDYKLELYHFAEAQKLIEEISLLELLNKYQKNRFYKIMRIVIYGTDNSLNKKHAEDMILYKDIINADSINLSKEMILNNMKFFVNSNQKENNTNQILDEIKLIVFECFLHGADISGSTKNFEYFITWAKKVLDEFCEQSKEVHQFDKTKEINCFENDSQKFREEELSFFEFVVDIFFTPFCDVFKDLNYLCINHEKNIQILKNTEKIFDN